MKFQIVDFQKGIFEFHGKTHFKIMELRKQQAKTKGGDA